MSRVAIEAGVVEGTAAAAVFGIGIDCGTKELRISMHRFFAVESASSNFDLMGSSNWLSSFNAGGADTICLKIDSSAAFSDSSTFRRLIYSDFW